MVGGNVCQKVLKILLPTTITILIDQYDCRTAENNTNIATASSPLMMLTSRLLDLYSIYRHLEMEYSKLPLPSRRYLYGNINATTWDVRALAMAKFLLASVLQWSPTTCRFRSATFVDAEQHQPRPEKEYGNELCPIWGDFFHDVVQADSILCHWKDETGDTGSLSKKAQVDALLVSAEAKLMWLQGLLLLVSRKGEYVTAMGNIELQPWMINEGWNRFCLNIARGVSFDATIAALRPSDRSTGFQYVHDLPIELLRGEYSRLWFQFSARCEDKMWMESTPSYFGQPVLLFGNGALVDRPQPAFQISAAVSDTCYSPDPKFEDDSPSAPPDSMLGGYNAKSNTLSLE